jgi:hypothetical protein
MGVPGVKSARRRLAIAARVIDRLRAGIGPSAAELRDAAYLETWVVEPSPGAGAPYVLSGTGYRLPLRRAILHDLVIAIDAKLGWARLPDEWVVLGERSSATTVDAEDALRRGAAWIERQLAEGTED